MSYYNFQHLLNTTFFKKMEIFFVGKKDYNLLTYRLLYIIVFYSGIKI